MATNAVRRPVPDSYSQLFPGRFLHADMLKGRKVTLTIKAIFGEDLTDAEEQTKPEWIVQFVERPFEWVMNRSNAYCLYRIFGGNPQTWVGHKVTLFPQPGTWFGEKGEAIRVWGSPELAEDLPITLKFLRKKKDRNMVMHRVESKPELVTNAPATEPTPEPAPVNAGGHTVPNPKFHQIFEILMWSPETQARWFVANAGLSEGEQIAKLEKELAD